MKSAIAGAAMEAREIGPELVRMIDFPTTSSSLLAAWVSTGVDVVPQA
jgi:hypothetical protein